MERNESAGSGVGILVTSVALVAAVIGAAFLYIDRNRTLEALRTNEETTSARHTQRQAALDDAARTVTDLQSALNAANEEIERLSDDKEEAEDKIDDLEKLARLDKQLLAKYSKIYFLNENYEPTGLSKIAAKYLLYPDRITQFHNKAYKYLRRMLDAAEDDGRTIKVVSAYRSFDTQSSLKSSYVVQYGSGANTFSADQGYSEHQLGTTVDLTSPQVGGTYASFADTDEYEWLTENAYRYGFILSYPPGNDYYVYEPWHWRFVGVDLARDIERSGESFYDMDQREIDEYLGQIFD